MPLYLGNWILGVIIGSGIFISPVGVLKYTGSPFLSICVWAGCGLYATIGALCYAELGTTIPLSGGDYIYIAEVFHDFSKFDKNGILRRLVRFRHFYTCGSPC